MTDADTIQYTAHYGRKMSDGNYGHVEASIYMPTTVPADTDPDSPEAAAAMTEAMDAARDQVTLTLNDRTVHRAIVKALIVDLFGEDAEEVWESATLGRGLPPGPPLFLSTNQIAHLLNYAMDHFRHLIRTAEPEGDVGGY